MLTVIIYAAAEYPLTIKTGDKSNSSDYWISKSLTAARIGGLLIDFDSEIIAITNHTNTLWLNPNWLNAPYVTSELLPHFPPNPTGISSRVGRRRRQPATAPDETAQILRELTTDLLAKLDAATEQISCGPFDINVAMARRIGYQESDIQDMYHALGILSRSYAAALADKQASSKVHACGDPDRDTRS